MAVLALASFAALSLISAELERRPNLGGPLGEALAHALSDALGYQSYLLLIFTACLAFGIWAGAGCFTLVRGAAGGAVVLLAVSVGAALPNGPAGRAGGEAGAWAAAILVHYINFGGGYLAVFFALVSGLTLMLGRAPTDLLGVLTGRRRAMPVQREALGPEQALVLEETREIDDSAAGQAQEAALPDRRIELRARADPAPEGDNAWRPRSRGGFKLPPNALLDSPPLERSQVDEGFLERSARVLEQKLAAFGVEGRVVEVQPGPVVTMYKFEPGSGIKVSQIVNLADDLSMALKALAVRIQAPVPGEAVVGIEVPNRRREKVYLREILEAEEFQAARSQLTIALGKDIAGRPVAADLARMPHLLIAGATGTGKSVSIHTMIASILFNATADDVRFVLIDPKMLELSVYENIPHLLVPVVVDPEKAASALFWATQEMERRYRMLRDMGVRNIDGYNQLVGGARVVELKPRQVMEEGDPAPVPGAAPFEHRRLPKIVIVIDELADLLLNEGKSVERDINRLAQKARAAGIHLILATQRPSVDVITGLIKANLPARISFQVTSRVDSRTILDTIGAERLLGDGDMLFMPPGTAKLRRLHGPFVSEGETRKVTDFLRDQGAPDYQMDILEAKSRAEADPDSEGGGHDEMYDEAVRTVMESGQASISMIQRRLRVGYNRAARMVEQMEREGLVLPADGARPREVKGLR